MITIYELNRLEEELKEFMKINSELYEKQKDALLKLMEDYQVIAKWHVSKGITDNQEFVQEIGYNLILSEDDTYIYYWDTERNQVNRFDLTQNKDRGFYNPLVFVRNGHFENAMSNILKLDNILRNKLESIKMENDTLKERLNRNEL